MRKNLIVDSLGDGGGDYQPTKLAISEFSSALKVGFPHVISWVGELDGL